MQLSRKQMKTFNRINEKLKTTPLFFITNYGYLVRKYSYLKKSHYIIQCQLKLKKNQPKVVLLFNQLKKFGLKTRKDEKNGKKHSPKKLEKKCHVRNEGETIEGSGGSQKIKPQSEKIAEPEKERSLDNVDVKIVDKAKDGENEAENMKVAEAVESNPTENEENTNVPPTTEDVNEQIREQLKLLQSGRRTSISLLTNNGNSTRSSSVIETKTSSCGSTPSFSRHTSYSSLDNEPTKSTDEKSSKSDGVTGSSKTALNQKSRFIDSLISKLKTQGLNLPTSIADDIQPISTPTSPYTSTHTSPEKLTAVRRTSFTECESSMDIINDDERLSTHSTSSVDDFLGFQETEALFERPNVPGMLPTPLVRKSRGVASAFVSKALDNFMTENALDNKAYTTAPLKKRHDEALMYADAEPPSLLCPQLPSDVEKPRTVAEKRQLLERKADFKYLMIENESTVYRELRKRSRTAPVPNYTLIRNIQEMNIPFTRDCWRATCWLNTPNGRFYYQTIKDHGKDVKVLGGRGNNSVKELVKLQPINKKKLRRQSCTRSCKFVGNIKINGLDELITESTNQHLETTFTSKKLNTLSDCYSFQKPCPLSKKQLNPIKSAIDVELGPLELYSLPQIQLQVWPKLDRPLPDVVHPYLKLALPYEKITPEWAEFALSTLKQMNPPPSRRKRKRMSENVDPNRSFTFNIPYTNNQSRILVRKRRKIVPTLMKLNSIDEDDKIQLSFAKNVDKSDDDAVAVADILTDMINSVALTLCESTVLKDDPDIDYDKVDTKVASGDNKIVGISAIDGKKKNTPEGKIVKELKKLNAKIIHGFDTVKKEECTNDFCKLGCICDSLRGAQTYSYHCKEVKCMFECKCPSSKVNTSTFESAVHNSDIKQFCDRMNASLAKEEKDFTATVVVSEGKTIYVPTWNEKKKRLKKVPKRLKDCVQFESDFVHRDLSETLLTKQEKHEVSDVIDIADAVTSKNDLVKNMIHVNVNVERLSVLDDLQPWCMVHCLYKCFCKFRAIDGQRFEFSDAKIDVIDQPIYTKRRQYTFERSKDESPNKIAKVSSYTNARFAPVTDVDYSSCRRVRVVATNHHLIVNRVRSENVRRYIKKYEEDNPGLKGVLRNRVKRCIAMPEVGTATVSSSNISKKSKPNNSTNNSSMELNKSSQLIGSDAMKQSIEKAITSSSLPVNDTVKIDENVSRYRTRFNNIIMKTMQGITQKLKTMIALPSPVNKAFYYMQWKHFLDAYNADRIYIWEVQLNTKEVLLVVTDKNIMPIVSNAMYVINIKAVSTERLPLLPKLIKLGVMNGETEKLSILLFGISNYWRVLGCTHSKNDFMNKPVVAVPTPNTNPRLATKISHLFDEMVQLTARNQSKKQSSIKSNICIRQLDEADIDNINLPIPVVGSHRWLMLSLGNDFTHIFVPEWKQFISHKKILAAIDHAKKSQKTVRLGPITLKPQIYVPHNSNMKLFFGPMQKNETLELQLLQQTDGKMLLREDYQRLTKQQPRSLTTGTWLYMKDDHVTVDGNDLDTKARTSPPKLNYFAKNPSTSRKFIKLKPSTVTTNNMNITLMSPSTDTLSNFATSTPSTSSNVPSSELIRHLSFGLRARPDKTLNKSNGDSSNIKVVDSSLLMAPHFMPLSSSSFSTPTLTASIQSKPITLSVTSNMQSNTESKNVSKGVPIRGRRFTAMPNTAKPILKSMLQQSVVGKSPVDISVVQPMPRKEAPNRITGRRYTTFVSPTVKPINLQRPNLMNFKLVQKPGNMVTLGKQGNGLTLTPISQLMLNRPVVIQKTDSTDSVNESTSFRSPSKTFERSNSLHLSRPLSPSNKPLTSTVATKLSNVPIMVVKPSTFNSNVSKNMLSLSVGPDRNSVASKKMPTAMPTVRPILNNKNISGMNKITSDIIETTEIIDSDDEMPPSPPKKQQMSFNSPSAEDSDTVNGYLISEVRSLGKFMAKKTFSAYAVTISNDEKIFHTFKHCTDFLNEIYLREHTFAMVPTALVIEWTFVVNEEDHVHYDLHNEDILRPSMVITKDELIDLNSDFHLNERFRMDLRNHLLVLRLALSCMTNKEARENGGLEIMRKAESVINELKSENVKLGNVVRALRIQKNLNELKCNELKKGNKNRPSETVRPTERSETIRPTERSETIRPMMDRSVIIIDSDDD